MNFITKIVKEQGVVQIISGYMKNKLHEKILEELKQKHLEKNIDYSYEKMSKHTTDYIAEHTWFQNSNKMFSTIIVKEIFETGDYIYFRHIAKGFSWNYSNGNEMKDFEHRLEW